MAEASRFKTSIPVRKKSEDHRVALTSIALRAGAAHAARTTTTRVATIQIAILLRIFNSSLIGTSLPAAPGQGCRHSYLSS